MLKTLAMLVALAFAPAAFASEPLEIFGSPPYDYPISNAYAATIIGTPGANIYEVVKDTPIKEQTLRVYPNREIPEGFWYYRSGLRYGEMLQPRPAPLIFIIGGTGAGYRSSYNVFLAKTLYEAGNHVILLPSPTHSNFIVTASSNFYPGNAQNDARDLYRVMVMIRNHLDSSIKITATGVTGYSLGAWNAAFVANLDSREKTLGFAKVLLINPPLSLYSSLQRLDAMLMRALPNGVSDLDAFVENAKKQLKKITADSDAFDFRNENMLYDTYLKFPPTDDKMATVIGLSFRISAANLIFTSDIMSHSGYVYPKDRPFLSTTPLDEYRHVALRTGLSDYFHDIYSAFYLSQNPGLTEQNLIDQSNLLSLNDWIKAKPDIYLITNRDDIILAPGEADELERLFSGKSWLFPTGGHMGNLAYPAFRNRILSFYKVEG